MSVIEDNRNICSMGLGLYCKWLKNSGMNIRGHVGRLTVIVMTF
ncbi:hypothetical protein [Marinifilum flexuosum]|nr:hypothetical protein [Marinifilum flexuosum]